MRSLPIKCTSCGKDLIVSNDISSLICGCCLESVDLDEARSISRQKEPSEFLIRNGVLEEYFGSSPYDIRIPSGVKKIEYFAFTNSIRSVIVPEGVEEIAAGAFACSFLDYLELPDSLKLLGTADPSYTSFPKAFMLEKMINSPVKPTIVCSSAVKKLLLESVDEENRDAVERGITWK